MSFQIFPNFTNDTYLKIVPLPCSFNTFFFNTCFSNARVPSQSLFEFRALSELRMPTLPDFNALFRIRALSGGHFSPKIKAH
jgi:hypothetical protein